MKQFTAYRKSQERLRHELKTIVADIPILLGLSLKVPSGNGLV
ncbi:hypothetical protein [Paenibacillus sp. NPDC055715]